MAFVKHSTVLENTDGEWGGEGGEGWGAAWPQAWAEEEVGLSNGVQTAVWARGPGEQL